MTSLISPYHGELVDLFVPPAERAELLARAAHLPSITLSERAFEDLELLASGGFSPLRSFLGKEDHDRVLAEMRLADGTLWPIPIVLPVKDGDRVSLDREVVLRGPRNEILAVMTVTEVHPFEAREEASALFGRFDEGHPLAAEMLGWGKHLVSGPLRVIDVPRPVDFRELRLRPAEVRERLAALGSPRVVAFQTRNPLHRSHEEMTKRAAERCGGTLLLHPVVGRTRPGDVDHFTRVRTYRSLVTRYYDPQKTLLSLLPLAMRMAGPREALWHGIVRRNHGASHFIVGRDHAGPAPGRDGRPFFGPYDAQELFERHQAELGIEMLAFREFVYLPDETRYEEEDRVPAGAKTLTISGTRVREEYLARGVPLPDWYTRPEIAEILRDSSPARGKRGFCVWFTGLSGSGKSATAEALAALLLEAGRRVTLLDGDVVRTHLSKGLGFSREDRDTNIRRIGWVGAELVRHGGAVICAAISPYRATRAEARALAGEGDFLEVFVDTPIEVCEKRDEKGLYAQARAGKLRGFTGVDDPYEAPEKPEVRLETTSATVEENARTILAELVRRGLVAG